MDFRGLPELPDDMAEAFDAMKMAIMHHQFDGWREISQGDAIEAMGWLVQMAMYDDQPPPTGEWANQEMDDVFPRL